MGSLANKSPSETFKSLLKVRNETDGISGAASPIEDGDGTPSSLSVSEDVFEIQPQNNDGVRTIRVRTQSGSSLLVVDTSNNLVNV